jgi:hypothetical protein
MSRRLPRSPLTIPLPSPRQRRLLHHALHTLRDFARLYPNQALRHTGYPAPPPPGFQPPRILPAAMPKIQ